MAGWFGKLMQKGNTDSRGAGFSKHADAEKDLDGRDARYDAVVQALRDRVVEDRAARDKRQRWYKQHLPSDAAIEGGASGPSPIRLHRVATKVPCRATPEARALLDKLRKRFPGFAVTFPPVAEGRQPVMLSGGPGATTKQIGWMEQCVETDPTLCNVRHQGLTAEVDGGSTLVLRFHHPRTAVRVTSKPDAAEIARAEFAELRPAMEPRAPEKAPSPRLVWLTRSEATTMSALQSRDYEAFYVRFKLEVLAGIWSALSGALSSSPGSLWHRGSHYSVVREPDAAKFRVHQKTVDDRGRAVDIGADRIYDAAPATDILLLYLEGDILADFADIYFTLHGLGSADSYFLKEELFTVIRRFWAGSQSLSSCYGSELAAVVRMSQRALPMQAQAVLLRQEWTNLRQSLVDRYGEGGRKADSVGDAVYRPRTGPAAWPFTSFPAGEVNLGLRVVYRQEWRHLGAQRGEVVRTVAGSAAKSGVDSTAVATTLAGAPVVPSADTTIVGVDATGASSIESIVAGALDAAGEAMKWPRDVDGSVGIGVRPLADRTELGLEAACRESSRDTSTRLTEIMLRMASSIRSETSAAPSTASTADPDSPPSTDDERESDERVATRVYSRLENRYEVLTRPAEIQNVVLVAEKLPSPAEIDVAWIRRHDWILAKALLDESFRDTLDAIARDAQATDATVDVEPHAKRQRLCDHLRANILHYQRAIWQHEDPQQRRLRYRKSGRKVPLDWRFELEAGGALSIEELGERLAAPDVDGQFTAYAGGREAQLDEVIDPAGPIGYYGNYAVYPMRPEMGGGELLSMLHFFKSPYLRTSADTGEPEIDDPVQVGPRRITLDSGALVVDVVRDAEAAPVAAEPSDRAIESIAVPSGYELILESAPRLAVLSTHAHRAAEAGAAVVRDGGTATPSLVAGNVGPAAQERDAEPVVVAPGVARRMPSLRTGRPRDPDAERVIAVGDHGDAGRALTAVTGAAVSDAGERGILVGRDAERIPVLRAGRAHRADAERTILAKSDEEPAAEIRVGQHREQVAEPMIVFRDDGELAASLHVGRPEAPAPLEAGAERLVLSRDDGGDSPRLSATAGGREAHARERMILAEGGEVRATTLRAGAGAGRVHERLILARYNAWLRPSLVAG